MHWKLKGTARAGFRGEELDVWVPGCTAIQADFWDTPVVGAARLGDTESDDKGSPVSEGRQ